MPVFVSPPSSSFTQAGDDESRLFQAIYRSRVADQGICAINLGGQALDWVLMFDDRENILTFLDHSLKRFQAHPDTKQTPSAVVAERHPGGSGCPALAAKSRLPQGTLAAEVTGRALDANGKLSASTVAQEHYARDQFYVMPGLQEELAKVFGDAGNGRVRIPDEFARLCVTYAHLGQTDVRPLSNPLGATSDLNQCEFWAEKVVDVRLAKSGDRSPRVLMRVEGKSDVTTEFPDRQKGFGHEIKLTWEGFIEMKGNQISQLLLSGRGAERLKWRSGELKAAATNPAASLIAGHSIDLACEVRYGIIGEPVSGLRK